MGSRAVKLALFIHRSFTILAKEQSFLTYAEGRKIVWDLN